FKITALLTSLILVFASIANASEIENRMENSARSLVVEIEFFDSPEDVCLEVRQAWGELAGQDIVMVEGIPVLFTTFVNAYGAITETASILERTRAGYTIAEAYAVVETSEGARLDTAQFMYSLVSVSDQRLYEMTSGSANPLEIPQRSPQQFNLISVDNSEARGGVLQEIAAQDSLGARSTGVNNSGFHSNWNIAPSTGNVIVEHWFNWHIQSSLVTPVAFDSRVSISNGGLRAWSNFGVANTSHIILSETITQFGSAWSFSFPFGFTISPQRTSAHYSSGTVVNTTMVTHHRPNFNGQWVVRPIVSRDLFSIQTTADVGERRGTHTQMHRANVGVIINGW
ncbi:MAG: hypothetical protein FWD96_03300, partial [Defluviitaleaceae bacterium]|nr:hypothetical protein [Defluviitaleaceae bacterium]